MNFDLIPKLVLTLPEKPHRREACAKHFADSGMAMGNVIFLPAINGDLAGLRTVNPYTVDDARDRPPEKWGTFFCGPHETGIWLSHYMAWVVASREASPHVAIFEDDCQLLPGWKERVNQALDNFPEWDWLFCGSCAAASMQSRHVGGGLHDVRYPCCWHFYIVNQKAIEVLLATQRKMWGPADVMAWYPDPKGGSQTAFDKLKVRTLLPRVANQFNTELAP